MLVLVEIGVIMLMVDLPNLLIHLSPYLSSWLLLVVYVWSLCEASLLFLQVLE
jgi:hypothetical protein